uniref:Uncharacterized protein n=1 Tax=Pyramimonas obovata TaxID=1411642 RepID=A0A7S0QWR3_9CHLO|mmetsp:Transcript_15671/g.33971  ORF Transcript_15671/g.33971 Transcript_15671/m.33971 type:complete len:461 (+) Transcript_15671:110-1492(+)
MRQSISRAYNTILVLTLLSSPEAVNARSCSEKDKECRRMRSRLIHQCGSKQAKSRDCWSPFLVQFLEKRSKLQAKKANSSEAPLTTHSQQAPPATVIDFSSQNPSPPIRHELWQPIKLWRPGDDLPSTNTLGAFDGVCFLNQTSCDLPNGLIKVKATNGNDPFFQKCGAVVQLTSTQQVELSQRLTTDNSSSTAASSHGSTGHMRIDVVITVCENDISKWVLDARLDCAKFHFWVTVKCDHKFEMFSRLRKKGCVTVRKLPLSYGKDAIGHLHHIIQEYDRLQEVVVFLKGTKLYSIKYGIRDPVATLLAINGRCSGVVDLGRRYIYGDGKIRYNCPAPESKLLIGNDQLNQGVADGSCDNVTRVCNLFKRLTCSDQCLRWYTATKFMLGVSRTRIHRLDRDVYQWLYNVIADSSRHDDEVFALERVWHVLWGCWGYLKVEPPRSDDKLPVIPVYDCMDC